MSLFKKKSSAEFDKQEKPVAGQNRGALIVLLILLGGFAYLYFFTSLIVPHEAAPVQSPAVSQEVKQSMPPKPTVPAPSTAASKEAAKPAETKSAPALPQAPAAPPVPAPAAAKAAPAPQPQAAAKPATPPPAEVPKKGAAAPARKEEVKPVKAAEPKPVQQVQVKEEPKVAKVNAAAPEKPAVKKKAESYTIAGEFPAGEEAAATEAKIAKLGVKPVVRREISKSRNMNRLYYGDYSDYEAYTGALDKLKLLAKGAFAIEKDGKYYLYAGSFASKDSAEKEKKDLLAKGLKLQIQPVVLPLSTVRITAGQFSSKSAAGKAVARLKSEGIAVKVVPMGR